MQVPTYRLSIFLSLESDESKPFASVVHVSHSTKLLKLSLEILVQPVLLRIEEFEVGNLWFNYGQGLQGQQVRWVEAEV